MAFGSNSGGRRAWDQETQTAFWTASRHWFAHLARAPHCHLAFMGETIRPLEGVRAGAWTKKLQLAMF
jgi:hypothetical protein